VRGKAVGLLLVASQTLMVPLPLLLLLLLQPILLLLTTTATTITTSASTHAAAARAPTRTFLGHHALVPYRYPTAAAAARWKAPFGVMGSRFAFFSTTAYYLLLLLFKKHLLG